MKNKPARPDPNASARPNDSARERLTAGRRIALRMRAALLRHAGETGPKGSGRMLAARMAVAIRALGSGRRVSALRARELLRLASPYAVLREEMRRILRDGIVDARESARISRIAGRIVR